MFHVNLLYIQVPFRIYMGGRVLEDLCRELNKCIVLETI